MTDPVIGMTRAAIIERVVSANGLSVEVLECGEGDRLALFLHGFPSHAMCWREQLPALAALGYRSWAPNQRGYGRTTRPTHVPTTRSTRC